MSRTVNPGGNPGGNFGGRASPLKRRDVLKAAGLGSAAAVTGAWSPPWKARPPQQTLLIAGSTTALPLTRRLAQAFSEANPDVDVVVDGGGSLAGLIAVERGAIDLAMMSHDLKRTEDSPFFRNTLFARDGVALVVAPGNPVRAISAAQAQGLLDGHIADWSAVGGPAGPVMVVAPPAGAPTRRTVEEVIVRNGDLARGARTARTTAELVQAVAGNPQAVGALSIKELSGGLTPLAIERVPMTPITLYSGRYPFTRSLYYVTGRAISEATRRYIAFVRSEAGQDLVGRDVLRVY
jgi:phosphate transport system substrate-binding protein